MLKDNTVYYLIVNKSFIDKDNDTEKAIYLLNLILHHFNIELPSIKKTTYGKPYFVNSNVYFNYSHSNSFIACAVSTSEVGIDIEDSSRIIGDEIANKYLDHIDDIKKRLEMWVKKESYSKLKGFGLQMKFNTIKLDNIQSNNMFITNDDYMCSIYCDNNEASFEEIKWSDLL